MIVDGYNVIHAWGLDTQNLEDARAGLLHTLGDFAGFSGEQITVVFDGYKTRGKMHEYQEGLLTVVFTAFGVTADTHIQRLVRSSKKGARVVTADYLEQLSVFEAGAVRVTPQELSAEIAQARERHVALLSRSDLNKQELRKRLRLDAISRRQ